MSNKSDYISYPGEIITHAPFQLSNTQIYSFILEGDKKKMQATLDKRLNKPFSNSGLRYKPLGSTIFFTFSVTANGYSKNPKDKNKGYLLEDEITFWMPTIEEKYDGKQWHVNRFAFFIPFIFVNNVVALVAGREIYGFPKTIGSFSIPTHVNHADSFTVDTMSFAKFSPNTPLKINKLLKVSREPIASGKTFTKDWTSNIDIIAQLSKFLKEEIDGDLLPDWNLIKSVFKNISKLEMPAVFLKQFPSALGDRKSVYQALINSGFQINNFHGGGLLHGDYTLSLYENENFPLTEALGLKDKQKVKSAFWINVDFENIIGTELFVS